MKEPILSLKNVVCKQKNTNVLSIKKFDIFPGATYLINGDMCTGKTLLLDVINNKCRYDGKVFFNSKLLKSYSSSELSSSFAYVEQKNKLPYFKTVKSYIESIIKKKSESAASVQSRLNNIVKIMNLKPILESKVRALTVGQFRWVVLSAHIASFPKVLFIDEIEQHLSLKRIKSLCKILYRKSNYEGITIVATTLNKDLFNSLSCINVSISDGRITSVRSPSGNKKYKK